MCELCVEATPWPLAVDTQLDYAAAAAASSSLFISSSPEGTQESATSPHSLFPPTTPLLSPPSNSNNKKTQDSHLFLFSIAFSLLTPSRFSILLALFSPRIPGNAPTALRKNLVPSFRLFQDAEKCCFEAVMLVRAVEACFLAR